MHVSILHVNLWGVGAYLWKLARRPSSPKPKSESNDWLGDSGIGSLSSSLAFEPLKKLDTLAMMPSFTAVSRAEQTDIFVSDGMFSALLLVREGISVSSMGSKEGQIFDTFVYDVTF